MTATGTSLRYNPFAPDFYTSDPFAVYQWMRDEAPLYRSEQWGWWALTRFDDVRDWVALQVSHDPAQGWVLAFAVLILAGLLLSLTVRRRRFWVRLTPQPGGGTRVELGGLARTDRAGYGEEFDRLRAELLKGRDMKDA